MSEEKGFKEFKDVAEMIKFHTDERLNELEKKLTQMQQIMQYWISRFPVKDKKVKAWIEGITG